MRLHPDIWARDCRHCLVYLYDEETGKPFIGPDGLAQRRPPGSVAPCGHKNLKGEPNCPKGEPFAGELYQCNVSAFIHYKECKAVGSFPDDPIVRQNAVTILQAEEYTESMQAARLHTLKEGRWSG